MLCEICSNWCRAIERDYLTNHAPSCPHYNDSLIDVWKVTVDGVSAYCDNEQDANETGEGSEIVKLKMHREVLEQMKDFQGF